MNEPLLFILDEAELALLAQTVSVREAAQRLGIKPDTVRHLCARRLLTRIWMDGRTARITKVSLEEHIRTKRPIGRPITTGAGLRRHDRQRPDLTPTRARGTIRGVGGTDDHH